jgi:outer membrane protein assembly factor BamB
MRAFLVGACLLALVGGTMAEDWPGWRGPTGQGISNESGLPLRWDGRDRTNVRWSVLLPGQRVNAEQDQNQSSPIVCGDRVFITTSYWPIGVSKQEFPEHHVVCYRARDGEMLWDRRVQHGPWLRASDLRGGYTAPTPACDGGRVYVLFGSSVLAALDVNGVVRWRQEIKPYNFDVAIGTSPVLYKDTVLLQCDQVNQSSRLLAFDCKSGELKWEKKRPKVNFSHSTPVLVRINDRAQLLVAASSGLQGVDPDTGEVLWWSEGRGDTASPVYDGRLAYLDSGRGGEGIAVDPTGSGGDTTRQRKWRMERVPEGFSSPVLVGEYLYRLCSPATLRCWKMATGEPVFSERLAGVSTTSSPITTPEGRIYLASAGKSYVLKVGLKPEVLAGNDLGDSSPASAAVAHGCLFLKGSRYLWCIGKP